VLKREFGREVGVLERTGQRWNGRVEAIDVFGRAIDPARPARVSWIVGEAKHNLTLREVERFARQVERARRHLLGEVYAVCFSYRARPEVRAAARTGYSAAFFIRPLRHLRFERVIDLKTTKALGLTIPPVLLFQADKVLR